MPLRYVVEQIISHRLISVPNNKLRNIVPTLWFANPNLLHIRPWTMNTKDFRAGSAGRTIAKYYQSIFLDLIDQPASSEK